MLMSDATAPPDRSTRLRALLGLAAILLIGAVVVIAVTLWVIGSPARSQAIALLDGLSLREFAALPDDDAYPAALAIAADGRVFTGSYQTGAIWAISPAGDIREVAGARDLIGSVTGLDIAPDGQLYILDRVSALESQGAVVWRYDGSQLERLFEIPQSAFAGFLPDDIAVNGTGRIYLSDRQGHVLRYDAAGQPLRTHGEARWWKLPCDAGCEATGLAYDDGRDALLVADAANDRVYRINLANDEPSSVETVFQRNEQASSMGLDGIDISPDGDIYLAMLARNHVARLRDGELVLLARDFRGAADLVYDAARDRLIIANWNQFSLGFGTRPQLPFALDVMDLGGL